MPIYDRLTKGWRWDGTKKVPMTEIEELRYLGMQGISPNASPRKKERGRQARELMKEKYPNHGVLRPKQWELEDG